MNVTLIADRVRLDCNVDCILYLSWWCLDPPPLRLSLLQLRTAWGALTRLYSGCLWFCNCDVDCGSYLSCRYWSRQYYLCTPTFYVNRIDVCLCCCCCCTSAILSPHSYFLQIVAGCIVVIVDDALTHRYLGCLWFTYVLPWSFTSYFRLPLVP